MSDESIRLVPDSIPTSYGTTWNGSTEEENKLIWRVLVVERAALRMGMKPGKDYDKRDLLTWAMAQRDSLY